MEEVDLLRHESVAIYDERRPEVWREKRCAANGIRRAHLQRSFPVAGRASAAGRARPADFRGAALYPSAQDRRQGGFYRRGLQWRNRGLQGLEARRRMPQPRAMKISVILDEVMPINGPLLLVPRSQSTANLKVVMDTPVAPYPLWTLDEDTVTRLVEAGGIVAPTGKPGGVLMFHGNLVHALVREHHALSTQDGRLDPERGLEPYLARRRGRRSWRIGTSPRSCRWMTMRWFGWRAVTGRPRNNAGMFSGRTGSVARPSPSKSNMRRNNTCVETKTSKPKREPVRAPIQSERAAGRIEPSDTNLHHLLNKRHAAGKPVRVVLIGAGKFRFHVPVASSAYAGIRGGRHCGPRSGSCARGLPHRGMGCRADRVHHIHR